MTTPPMESVPPLYNRLARAFTWLLLLGLTFLTTAHVHPRVDAQTDSSTDHDANPTRTTVSYETEKGSLTFPIMVLPPLCCFLASLGIGWISFRRREDYLWLADQLFLPNLTSSLAGLALVFFLVYKDGFTMWLLMETATAIVAGGYSAIFLVGTVIARRKHSREMERRERELEGGTRAPQIPEVERVTSLKEELLPGP